MERRVPCDRSDGEALDLTGGVLDRDGMWDLNVPDGLKICVTNLFDETVNWIYKIGKYDVRSGRKSRIR
jgi:hypothetical protein